MYPILEQLSVLGVQLSFSPVGKIRLQSTDNAAIQQAIEFVGPVKDRLQQMFLRSQDLLPCPQCQGKLLAVPTFDYFENFECMACDICTGCRKGPVQE